MAVNRNLDGEGPDDREATETTGTADFAAENDVLTRAARELRDDDTDSDAQWLEITDRVLARVRATTRHGTPLRAEFGTDTLYITDLVIKHRLRDALENVSGTHPIRVTVEADDSYCTGLEIELSAVYRTDLRRASASVRNVVHSVLTDILGDYAPPRSAITLHFGDVTIGGTD